jgi:hypothetical protein
MRHPLEVAADASQSHRHTRHSRRAGAQLAHAPFLSVHRTHRTGRADRARHARVPARHLRHTTHVRLKPGTIGDEREALLILLDFLLGSSIDEIATTHRVDSRSAIEDALRLVLLRHGFTAAHGVDS